ncbi:MAG: hypothetical protein CVV07_05340 [Gammaproteobacteria bacterium HGW-Gammaproteobacteria-11]|nr:MAG: hypothetical protein CVV07_05340 [Gammaproteobacteria bacterium HGW-Gammaproteobacteria-11]
MPTAEYEGLAAVKTRPATGPMLRRLPQYDSQENSTGMTPEPGYLRFLTRLNNVKTMEMYR